MGGEGGAHTQGLGSQQEAGEWQQRGKTVLDATAEPGEVSLFRIVRAHVRACV